MLDPLLFLVYAIDLPGFVNCNINLFADDGVLWSEVYTPNSVSERLYLFSKKIQGWSTNWHMTLNTEMSEVMAISTKRNKSVYPGLLIDDKRLKEISSHKHLGPTLSSDMSWTAHANILHACLQKCGSKTKLMEKACI